MNGSRTDISIIIPCHNLELYIDKLLLSFYMLNLNNIQIEFIFVLDDCTDKTEEIIKQYMAESNYYIYKCNYHSCGFARNLGLGHANGEYIWFVDGDDWIIYPNVIQDCLALMKNSNLDIIMLRYASNFFKWTCHEMVWQYIFSKALIGNTRFVREQPAEDGKFVKEIVDKLSSTEIQFYNIPSYFYNYKRPGSNMTNYIATGSCT